MQNNPKIVLQPSRVLTCLHLLGAALLVGTFVYIIIMYQDLPKRVPIHFNMKGEVDGWGNKATLFAIPLTIIPAFAVLFFLSRVPHTFNYSVKVTEENAPRLYHEMRLFVAWFNVEIAALMAFISIESIQLAKGNHVPYSGWVIGGFIFLMLLQVVMLIIRMRRLK